MKMDDGKLVELWIDMLVGLENYCSGDIREKLNWKDWW